MRRKLDAQLGLTVPAEMISEIDRAADQDMCSRSAFVRKAIAEQLRRYEQRSEPVAA